MLILLLFLMLISVGISYFLGFFSVERVYFLSSFIMFLCWLIVVYYFCTIIFYNEKTIFINLGF